MASVSISTLSSVNHASAATPWVSDRGDGTYRNPVLYADYSDPDAIRVGDDYWLTASSFCHAPGLPILHSRDLVNWTLVNHALPALVPVDHFAQPRHGQGVWAPALRFQAGRFWIFYPDPDFGIYVITATDPRGAWSAPVLVKSGKGLIDPCPLWDDDGQVYLVHGWAKSRAGICNLLTLHQLSADATRVIDAGKIIIDANQLPGWRTLEGPKFYKREGYYYLFAPAGGVAEGYQAVFRARDISGPYESRIVLDQGSTPVNGPHQGAWVDTPAGEHWFFHFQEVPAFGRIVHLQPMRWRDDGWPVMGRDEDDDGKGEPVLAHAKPALPIQSLAVPATSDNFAAPQLGLQWQWQANPQPSWSSHTARLGALRLGCVPAPSGDSHWLTPQLLLQKFSAPAFTATVALEFHSANDGDAAGLMVFGHDYAWLGFTQLDGRVVLALRTCVGAHQGGRESLAAAADVVLGSRARMQLRVSVGAGAACEFAFSVDGKRFTSLGALFQAKSSYWVGAKVGIFATAVPGDASAGWADFEKFTVEL
ncbi:glycoside hydrolase family 43 protein [Oleiharenicola lentus]|uniref:glycoside hydrolase family 43 protein n=1 Tax=Oleiharenicola lentus TaxID=2508720 RepID=UPI003F66D44B